MTELTQTRLKELLHYDPDTGVFTWLVSAGRIKDGDVAGCVKSDGYRKIGVNGKLYPAHRLAWLYMAGSWPSDQTDHRNGIRDDNRWGNLRAALPVENQHNRKTPVTSTSGSHGVSWHKKSQKWRVQIRAGGDRLHLGLFNSPKDAHEAYLAAKAIHHPFQPVPREEPPCASR